MYLIVGLGNPEEKYIGTRHNLGFETLDELARKLDAPIFEKSSKFESEISKISDEIILVKPQTYMNNSGRAVAKIAKFYKIPSENIIVIHDELDLLLGHLKLRSGGGAGGNHGVESVIESLGTDQFIRVRLGIGNGRAFAGEHKRVTFNAEHFVMEQFLVSEKSKMKSMIKLGIKSIEVILKEGIERAQNQFH